MLTLGAQSVRNAMRAGGRVLFTDDTVPTSLAWSLWVTAGQREIARGAGTALGLANGVFLVRTLAGQAELRSTATGALVRSFASASGLSEDGAYVWSSTASGVELHRASDGSLIDTLVGVAGEGSALAESGDFFWARDVPGRQLARYNLASRTTTATSVAASVGFWSQDHQHFAALTDVTTRAVRLYDRAGRSIRAALSVAGANRGVYWTAPNFDLFDIESGRMLSTVSAHPEFVRSGYRASVAFADDVNAYALDGRGYLAIAPLDGSPMQLRATPYGSYEGVARVFPDRTGAVIVYGALPIDWSSAGATPLGCGQALGVDARSDGLFVIATNSGAVLVNAAVTPATVVGRLLVGLQQNPAINGAPTMTAELYQPRTRARFTPDGRQIVLLPPAVLTAVDASTYAARSFDDGVADNFTFAMSVANGPRTIVWWSVPGTFALNASVHDDRGAVLRALGMTGTTRISPLGTYVAGEAGLSTIAGDAFAVAGRVVAWLTDDTVLSQSFDAFGRVESTARARVGDALPLSTHPLPSINRMGTLQTISPTVVYATATRTRYDLAGGPTWTSAAQTSGLRLEAEASAMGAGRVLSLEGLQLVLETP